MDGDGDVEVVHTDRGSGDETVVSSNVDGQIRVLSKIYSVRAAVTKKKMKTILITWQTWQCLSTFDLVFVVEL